jgi:hypothetical protein
MNYNQLFNENVPQTIEPRKWWQYSWVKIISTSIIVLIILAITLSLVLTFVVVSWKNLKITTTIIASSPPVTTTITTTTTQQSSKLYISSSQLS